MAVRAYYREDLALAQLEVALRLFFEDSHFAAVVTLAGAADEVFGQLLAAQGRVSSLEILKKSVAEIHMKMYGEEIESSTVANRANRARNSLKHWSPGQPEIVKFDLIQEATDMLFRAIDNYWALKQTLTPEMERFQRATRAA